ncbi:N-acetylneuraminate synthase [Nitrococcus mobilis]|uniref:N-acetylneuraminic acid synthase n=1 Tax=Nitrococcus mobilis Nb-231 TaxID=314278 RepID=A4BMG3_9GAMM|nr:N-acetylneuraminate synthase [Nitrococcus mobilis]EAR23501.1 N-acetylneuraminic acid synthase [Nitrococcus mobilis Nb-231]
MIWADSTTVSQRVRVIAEAGVNHNGSLDLALRLVDAAAEAGADAVKFQTFKASAIVSRFASKASYQKETTGTNESQLEMVRKLELPLQDHHALLTHCKQRSIEFLSTPFDRQSARFLICELGLERIKLASGEITNAPLLLAVAQLGKPVILSTGMSTLAEVENALGVLAFGYLGSLAPPDGAVFRDAFVSSAGQSMLAERVSLLHCTTEYPAPFEQVNLRTMDTLAVAFSLPVGLSDHTLGIAVPIAAVARGACIIEKHFTLDKTMPGPDHRASLEPAELAAMVSGIRQVEAALGSPVKRPSQAELSNRSVARKSLVALRPVQRGEVFSDGNLGCKRPGQGLSPFMFWDTLGRAAVRDFDEDEPIEY